MRTVYGYLSEHGGFHAFLASAKIAGLESYLRKERDFTLFAPTDAAFAEFPPDIMDGLLARPDALFELLAFHYLPERLTTEIMRGIAPTEMLAEKRFTVCRGCFHVNGTKIVEADIECSNGIIHAISGILRVQGVRI